METNELMMRTGTGRTKYGHKREGNTGHGEHRSDDYNDFFQNHVTLKTGVIIAEILVLPSQE